MQICYSDGVSICLDSCGRPADVYSVNPTIAPQDDTVRIPITTPIPKLTPKPKPSATDMSKNPQSVLLPIMALATA